MSFPTTSAHSLSFSYREKMSWEVCEDNIHDNFQLSSFIPGTFNNSKAEHLSYEKEGGYIEIDNGVIVFLTFWPKEVDLELVHVNVEYKVKVDDWEVDIKGSSETERDEFDELYNILKVVRKVNINKDLVSEDADKSFILEADIVVNMKKDNISSTLKTELFLEDVKSIFDDKETSDVLVIAEGKEFKCHRNILRARSEVFKNMLGHDTLESKMNKIVIKENAAEAVEDMLKYLYSGKIPIDPKRLTTELLQLADMHQLHPLLEACLENLISSLDESSCISTLILVDKYQPLNESLRQEVIKFIKCKATKVEIVNDCDKLVDSHPTLAKELMSVFVRESKEIDHMCSFCAVSYK